MKEPTRGPIFACLYPGLCDIARKHGYALSIHGTVTTDLDLVAIPWTAEAVDGKTLKDALLAHIGACGYEDLLRRDCPHLDEAAIQATITRECNGQRGLDNCEIKPHGRLAWNLYLREGAKVDLSVMPILSNNQSNNSVDAAKAHE